MRVISEIFKRKAALFGLLFITIVVVAALAAPMLAPYSPDEQMLDGLTLEGAPVPPSVQFPLGTDTLGRDLLSRRFVRRSRAAFA